MPFPNPVMHQAFVAEMEKLAYCGSSPGSYEDEWLAKFKGTPLYEAAKKYQADQAQVAVIEAQRDIERQQQYITDSIRRLHRTKLEAALAAYKAQGGKVPEPKKQPMAVAAKG